MTKVTYEVSTGSTLSFVADVAEFGPVQVRSSRKGIFACRVTDKRARETALLAVERFVDDHAAEMQAVYDEFAKAWSNDDHLAPQPWVGTRL
jgi:hypothetical protein